MDNFQGIDPKYLALIQAGMGILAANNGKQPASATIGQGLLGGANAYQQNLQQQQEMAMRKQDQDMQNQLFSYKQKEYDRDQNQFDLTEKAIADASAKNPEFASMYRLDPKSATKALYPQANSADPYYTPVYDAERGLGAFDNRKGVTTWQEGSPIIKPADSPTLRGAVKEAESRAAGNYKPNTSIDGVVKTDTQISDMARGTGGVKVPTKAQEAADVQTAKDQAEFNSPENVKKRTQALQFKKTSGQVVLNAIDDIEKRIGGMTAGVGGRVMRNLPINSQAYDVNADIETVKANFGFDRLQAMRDMSPTGGALGQVAVQELMALQASVANLDPNQSPQQLKKNLAKAKQHYVNWMDTLDANSNGSIMPKDEPMPTNMPKSVIAPIGGKKIPLKLGADGLYYDAQGNGYRKPK
jgi:hypothetical protein